MLGDFVFQSNALANTKKNTKQALKHVLMHFVLILILGLIYYLFTENSDIFNYEYLIIVGIVLVFHFLIDRYLKTLLTKVFKGKEFFPLLIDQGLHLLIIIFSVYYLYGYLSSIPIFLTYNQLVLNIYQVLIFLILLTSFTSLLIAKLFADLETNDDTNEVIKEVKITERIVNETSEVVTETIKIPKIEVNDFGKWIGYFERIIIFILFLLNSYEGIALVIALKTFARFKQLNQKKFSEKYVLGTLFSVEVALILGYIYLL